MADDLEPWQTHSPKFSNAIDGTDAVRYAWTCKRDSDPAHEHTIECLWVWHDCGLILGPDSVAPGARFGWRPTGVRAHTLVQVEPLTITASVYWPECCGLHGFITDGRWIRA